MALRQYLLSRYMQFVKRYITSPLDKRFPAAMRVYRVFMWGTKVTYVIIFIVFGYKWSLKCIEPSIKDSV